ncbi:female-specific histamine-binding protein 1-like [Rhipicephalus microplus]|uniref:female-specific histamine-binding protein 1-like n=1 Tax=Rhipicephalus microplus TaxID=6941 RepID=UPI003F6AC987
MKLLVFSLAFASALSHVKGDKPVWADEAANGAHQDALKHLNKSITERYDLLNATYRIDPVWGNNFTCVGVSSVSFNEDEKSALVFFLFRNEDDALFQGSYEKATAVKMYGYSKENAITYETGGGQNFTDVLAFSDDNCYVVYALGANGTEGGYELWVTDFNNVPTCCLEKFNEYAAGLPVRGVYTRDCIPELD